LKIDDPLEAAPMHGFCGALGVLWVGFMAKRQYVQDVFGIDEAGVFYGGGGKLLAAQLIGIMTIAAWTMGMLGAFFGTFKKFGLLRVEEEEELVGLDESKHGGNAYNI
jgi:Amt family ammonium transporter